MTITTKTFNNGISPSALVMQRLTATPFRSISTSSSIKRRQDTREDAVRRKQAEELAERDVRKWSSPLFSHVQVDVDTHKNRQFSFAENATFVLAVVCIFGYFGNFAIESSRKKEEKKRKLKEKRERRALKELRMTNGSKDAVPSYIDDEDEDEEDDPFEGLTPQEIVQLKEKVERENFRK